MGKSTSRIGVLGALAMAGVLCMGTTAAQAQTINVGSASGAAGSQVTIDVTLSSGGASISAALNGIGFDASTPIAPAPAQGNCAITTGMTCTMDSDCPVVPPPLMPTGTHEPCVNQLSQNAPDCTVNAAIGKGGFFAFTPNVCSNEVTKACTADADCTSPGTCGMCAPGTSCTGIRALIVGLASGSDLSAIADGSTLYSCKVNIAGDATGTHTLTATDVSVADTTGTLVAGATGANGTITVGIGGAYTVCDVSNDTGDNAGQFGDGSIDIFDVRAIFAAAQLGTDAPADGTARFSAMDSSTLDNPPACGGDAALDIFDVRQCFGVAQLGNTNFVRTGTGASCTSAVQPQ